MPNYLYIIHDDKIEPPNIPKMVLFKDKLVYNNDTLVLQVDILEQHKISMLDNYICHNNSKGILTNFDKLEKYTKSDQYFNQYKL